MSGFGKLNLADLGKGILIAFLTVVVGNLQVMLTSGSFPDMQTLGQWAIAGGAAAAAYLLKNLFTNSNNELGKTESKPE